MKRRSAALIKDSGLKATEIIISVRTASFLIKAIFNPKVMKKHVITIMPSTVRLH